MTNWCKNSFSLRPLSIYSFTDYMLRDSDKMSPLTKIHCPSVKSNSVIMSIVVCLDCSCSPLAICRRISQIIVDTLNRQFLCLFSHIFKKSCETITPLLTDNSTAEWGLTLPEQPIVSATSGSLPTGTYQLCFTKFNNREISGNGAIAEIELTAEGGITISNRAADSLVWITDPNGSKFYLAGQMDVISTTASSSEPLPSFLCSPPPFMKYITYAFGRVWGSMPKSIKIANFIGMQNIKTSESLFVGKAGAYQFRTILDSDSLAVSCTIALRF